MVSLWPDSPLTCPVLAELEACAFRNKSPQEIANHMKPLLDKYLPLESNSSHSPKLFAQRQKDHYSHFILRLAFARTEDLRRRFVRVETMLFRLRLNSDDLSERSSFIRSLDLDWWETVTEDEKREYASELAAMSRPWGKNAVEDDNWFKVNWDRVPELVEQRKVFLKAGKAFVPGREQASMVIGEFVSRLERQLEVGNPGVETATLTNNSSSRRALSPASTRTTASPPSSTTFPRTSSRLTALIAPIQARPSVPRSPPGILTTSPSTSRHACPTSIARSAATLTSSITVVFNTPSSSRASD